MYSEEKEFCSHFGMVVSLIRIARIEVVWELIFGVFYYSLIENLAIIDLKPGSH